MYKDSALGKFTDKVSGYVDDAKAWAGEKANRAKEWALNKVANKISSMRRKNERAVDFLNTYREDFDKLSFWERTKWSIQNPIARLTAKHRKEGTRERKKRSELISKYAEQYRATLPEEVQKEALKRLHMFDKPAASTGAAAAGSQPEDKRDKLEDTSSVVELASKAAGVPGGDLEKHYKA